MGVDGGGGRWREGGVGWRGEGDGRDVIIRHDSGSSRLLNFSVWPDLTPFTSPPPPHFFPFSPSVTTRDPQMTSFTPDWPDRTALGTARRCLYLYDNAGKGAIDVLMMFVCVLMLLIRYFGLNSRSWKIVIRVLFLFSFRLYLVRGLNNFPFFYVLLFFFSDCSWFADWIIIFLYIEFSLVYVSSIVLFMYVYFLLIFSIYLPVVFDNDHSIFSVIIALSIFW